ncbi:insulin-like receptor [Metopolophium dirhodum]|uniref:insulin-like receptor n=1 Tax=Metopolophium dirhodum TaxID=44670 RepID=UPI002990364D|nr:insulin-like receptor [Metopolophium dirhodum]XP_060876854.1 insulin-like receptor [Metopolophium dirhodum]XP_060876855.1 insulin-like receptor [Metopolophium dirhodum]
MCGECDKIRCLRDSCPGLGGCRLCGNFSSNIYYEHYNFLRPSSLTKFSKVNPKHYRKPWLIASKSVWKSDFLCIALWCVAILSVSQASAEHQTQITSLPPIVTQATNNSGVHFSAGRICQSKDIRNKAENLNALRGCRVIEGFLQIVLIDNANETSYESLSFPELREITGYLLLYRVNGLKSLAKLFPNLSVIRGQDLFMSYAIAIYEMVHLQELGLYNLMDVVRGAVYITKNPMLCFTQTIDWIRIAPSGKESHDIYDNRPVNACPVCPWTNDISCSVSNHTNEPLCWNTEHCQRICPPECGNLSCTDDGTCCHEQCLGGCTGKKHDDCFACKYLADERDCVKECPAETLTYQNRRCILERDCYRMPRSRDLQNGLHLQSWKPFNNKSCVMECPPGFEEVPTENSYGKVFKCQQCSGPCRKVCIAANVESIQSAQKLKGCVIINGSLEIQIRGGMNIVKELEESLSMIEEITGYLKVVRSFPLVSLTFLRKLHVIRGETLESSKYALVVLDNQNLVELWDWSTRKPDGELRIERGQIFFHFNPKLCIYRIKQLQTNLGDRFKNVDDLEVAPNSNGDKMACTVKKLNVSTEVVLSNSVLLKWSPFEHYDTRTLLGYVVYYLEAPYKNVSLYDGRDACGGDGWKTDDVESTEVTTYDLVALITGLKPYTQYAYYVKTYTMASESNGAQSDINYFRTMPGTPSPPQNLRVKSVTADSISIEWMPPAEPNGELKHYIIKYTSINISGDSLLKRDYCQNSPNVNEFPDSYSGSLNEMVNNDQKENCNCTDQPEKKQSKIKDEQQIQIMIEFENNLQNILYVKTNNPKSDTLPKKKRDVSNFDLLEFPNSTIRINLLSDADKNLENENKKIVVPSNQLTFTLHENLTHFTSYNIELYVCREWLKNEIKEPNQNISNCSIQKAMTTAQTSKKESADRIDPLTVKAVNANTTSPGSIKIFWKEPEVSNGPIVSYQLEYKKVGDHLNPPVVCITRQQYQQSDYSHTLSNVAPGNYSFRLRARSLADYGEFTQYSHFLIPEALSITTPQLMFIIFMVTGMIGAVIMLIFYVLHRYYKNKLASTRLFVTCNPDYVSCEYQTDEWEIPRDDVEVLEPLGRGSFGMVYRGNWKKKENEIVPCAIKTVTENNNLMVRHDFLSEANVMKEFCSAHVVRLYGVVSQGQPAFVLMELMPQGDLKSYLLKHRPEMTTDPSLKPPTLRDNLRMAIEIADGMSYLSFKKYVHRDLAARNCMVSDNNIVKIGDFGLTRDIYQTDYYRKDSEGMMPIRWMAPESLQSGLFTCFSDVWSYGIVLWEMVTLAAQPYRGEIDKNVISYVSSGGIMEKPDNCPDIIYDCMKLCWRFKASERPTFAEIVKMFLPCARSDFAQTSFFHNELQSETQRLDVSENGITETESLERERKQTERDQITTALENQAHYWRGSLPFERLAPKADLEEDDDDEEDSDNELQRLHIENFACKRPPNGYMSIHNGNGINTTIC